MYRQCFQVAVPRSRRGYHPLAVPPVATGGVVAFSAHQPVWLQAVLAAPHSHPDAAYTTSKWELWGSETGGGGQSL